MTLVWIGLAAWALIGIVAVLIGTRLGRAGNTEDRKMMRDINLPL